LPVASNDYDESDSGFAVTPEMLAVL